jgi:hypothetical protein
MDEPPSEFEKHGLDLLRAIADARRRGATEEHRRLLDELRDYNQRKRQLVKEKREPERVKKFIREASSLSDEELDEILDDG